MTDKNDNYIKTLCDIASNYNQIPTEAFSKYGVKKGLRNPDGSGVMAGVSLLCNVKGYIIEDGEHQPTPGKLIYRGIDVKDIILKCQEEDRFGFEEVAYLLLLGHLPNKDELSSFKKLLGENRELPDYFIEDIIIKNPSKDVMNKMASSVLALYTYDENPESLEIENLLRQSISLISKFTTIAVNAYQAKKRYFDKESFYIHYPKEDLTTAENFLYTLRNDSTFTDEEAKLLDLCLVLHMDHGGGNNSTFTTRVLSSSGTDTYSAIAGALGSLKGPKHGGANIKVVEMLNYIKNDVGDYTDEKQLYEYMCKLVRKEAGDRSGLIYGMGHAVYSISDPRAELLKQKARELAEKKGLLKEFILIENVEKFAPSVLEEVKGKPQQVCANVDLYSGFVYEMLGIEKELYTPLFAIARIVGWCAHRIEEIMTSNKIIRPAYKCIMKRKDYIDLDKR